MTKIKVKGKLYSNQNNSELDTFFILDHISNNNCIAQLENGNMCSAIYNPIVGIYYADDKYGLLTPTQVKIIQKRAEETPPWFY